MFPVEGPELFEPVLPRIFQAIVDGKVLYENYCF